MVERTADSPALDESLAAGHALTADRIRQIAERTAQLSAAAASLADRLPPGPGPFNLPAALAHLRERHERD